MKLFFKLVLFFLPVVSLSQEISNLKIEFLNKINQNDTNLYYDVEKIIDYYLKFSPDSSLKYIDLTIKFAQKTNNKKNNTIFLIKKGDVLLEKNEYYESITTFYSALNLISNNVNSKIYADLLLKTSIAIIYAGFNYSVTKKYLQEAISIYKNSNYKEGEAQSLCYLSYVLALENKLDSSFYLLETALNISNEINNKQSKAQVYYCYSKIYSITKEYTKSTIYIKKSITLTEKTDTEPLYLFYLACNYYKMQEYYSALNIYKISLKSYLQQNNLVKTTDIYLQLAKIYNTLNNIDSSIFYAQNALKISKDLNLLKKQQEAYYCLSLIYTKTEQIDLALHSYKKYSELRDSLFSAKTANEGNLLYNNYLMQIKLKDQQILFNQKEFQILKNKQQKLAIYILTLFGIFLFVLLLILYRLYKLKRRNEHRLKQLTEATLEGVFIHDGQNIIDVNDKFCELTGYERNELIGKSIFFIISEKSKAQVREKMNLKRTVYYVLELIRKNNLVFEAELLSKPLIYMDLKAKIVAVRDLSEIKEIKEKLHFSTTRFEALIEKSPDGVVITDSQGNITYVSPAFIDLFNDKVENDFITKKLSDFVTPLYKNKVITDFKNMLIGEYSGVTEYVAKNKSQEFYIECNGDVIRDLNGNISGIFMIVRNITERKLTEAALINSESRFKGLFNSSKDAIIIHNNNFKIVDANPKSSELYKYSYDELLTMDFRELLPPEMRNIKLQDYESNEEFFESYSYAKNRRRIYVQISISQLIYSSEEHYLLTIRDMTVFKRQEDNLRRIATKLQSTNATKDKIFSIISHDLRGPIGNLKSMIEFIAENQNEFDMAEIVDIMKNLKQSSSTTYELLENLLSWAKSQQNLLEYKPTIFNISEIIKNTVELSNQYAKNKQIEIQNFIEDNIDVIGDENMIKTVIRNLLSNSIKFTKSNGRIFVNGRIDDDYVIISIKDTGIGMNQDTAVKLFDDANFFTTYGTNNEKGTGLGLKLCKDFLSKNSGKIWVESEPNIGSTFYFTIRKA